MRLIMPRSPSHRDIEGETLRFRVACPGSVVDSSHWHVYARPCASHGDGPHSRTMMRQACENLKSAVRWGNAQAQSLSQAVTVTHPGPGRGRRRGVRLRRGESESSPDWRFFLFDHTFVA
jgi:hypothetical protein